MTLLADGGRQARGAHIQRGGRLGDARGEQLRAMALAAAARRLCRQPLDLLLAHGHRLEVLARKQHLRGTGITVEPRAALSAAPAPGPSAAASPTRGALAGQAARRCASRLRHANGPGRGGGLTVPGRHRVGVWWAARACVRSPSVTSSASVTMTGPSSCAPPRRPSSTERTARGTASCSPLDSHQCKQILDGMLRPAAVLASRNARIRAGGARGRPEASRRARLGRCTPQPCDRPTIELMEPHSAARGPGPFLCL